MAFHVAQAAEFAEDEINLTGKVEAAHIGAKDFYLKACPAGSLPRQSAHIG